MTALNEFCDIVDTYGGRDKVLKALCYVAKLTGNLQAGQNADLSRKLLTFSSQISSARTTLRLIDDIPLLRYTLEYGWGKEEPDRTMSIIGVLTNIVDHIYYPVEKICWLAEHRLLHVQNPGRWDVISAVFYVSSIYLNLMRSLRMVALMEQHKRCILKLNDDSGTALLKLGVKQNLELVSVVRLSLDLLQAGSTLPKGYLWGGRLESWHVGLIGSVSAFIGLYQIVVKRNIAKQ